jgi:hypothetical protein
LKAIIIQSKSRIQAKTIVLKNQLIATNTENEFLYKHFNAKLGFARINLVSKSCTCHKYLDKGVCKHLIAACIQTRSNLPGLAQLPKKFKIVRRKKTRRYIDDSRDEEQMLAVDNHIIEPISLESIVPVVHVAVPIAVPIAVSIAESIAEPITQIAPKKRGRKPKIPGQIVQKDSQMGRPPLARDALQISPRRSSRIKK